LEYPRIRPIEKSSAASEPFAEARDQRSRLRCSRGEALHPCRRVGRDQAVALDCVQAHRQHAKRVVDIGSGRKSPKRLRRENELFAPFAQSVRIDLSASRSLERLP
jgi:hypothetical protein